MAEKITLHTIAPGLSFVDDLALGLLERFGSGDLGLAEVTVLLPTRRACRALREAFLRQSGGAPLLLPHMAPLGDMDAEALALSLEEIPGVAERLDLPPALPALRRRLLLARAIGAAPDLAATAAQAVRLSETLSRLLDQVETEGLDFATLTGLVPADYAGHWQLTLDFLRLLTSHWPAILETEGAMDGAARRNLVLLAQADAWRARPPPGPVIAAGSTGSIPATATLLATIAALPQGALVLPGLDQTCDTATWDAIGEDAAHPQHNLHRLLSRLNQPRTAVTPWRSAPQSRFAFARQARTRLLTEALRPAAVSEAWQALAQQKSGDAWVNAALDGLERWDCPTPEEESGAIALRLRHALETPGITAALVTSDRTLARRVAVALERWGIAVDDSGGQPLADTPVGSFLALAAQTLAERFAPVTLLSLLKHPLAAGGMAPGRFRAEVEALEQAVLRGPCPAPGLEGLMAAVGSAEEQRFTGPGARDRLLRLVLALGDAASAFLALAEAGPAPLMALVRAHIRFLETLATSRDAEDALVFGPDRLWRREDGEAAASFIAELLAAAADFPALAASDYPAVLENLMAGHMVRPRWGRHPRLFILGPLEARLQHVDLMILGGLNEGVWPAEPPPDPWLSRPMRRAFGLPSPERQIGLAAHDFTQAAAAPQVVLTRSERSEGTPTVPSRWLSRLDTVLQALGRGNALEQGTAQWLTWVRALDQPEAVMPVVPPEPRPPLAARPRTLSVTEVETWVRNPYALYARRILGLIPLDPLAADPGAAERGQFVHRALHNFVAAHPGPLPPKALERLLDHGREAFGDLLARPDVWAFWWPRFQRIACWFIATEATRRGPQGIHPTATEIKGRLQMEGRAGPFDLIARADRVDRNADGSWVLLDYKTGLVPSAREVAAGFAPQLPLEAVMLQAGSFAGRGVPAGSVGELAYWHLGGGEPAGKITLLPHPAQLAEEAHGGLERLIWTFDDPATPYRPRPRPAALPRRDDYAHLARAAEWSAGESETEGDA